MTERTNLVPKRRFKEYHDTSAWEKRKVQWLIDEGIIEEPMDGNHGEKHPTASEYVDNGIPFLMATDIKNGIVDIQKCNFITLERSKKLDKGFAKNGDVLITHKATIGEVAILSGLSSEYAVLTPQVTYYRVIDKSRLAMNYLYAYFNSPDFQNVLKVEATQSTRSYIGITGQHKLDVKFPIALKEQEKIGDYFSDLDHLITLHERKLEKTKALKSAYLSEMFPAEGECEPRRRFAGFTDAWEQRRFDSVFDPISSNTLSRADLNYEDGKIKSVHYGDILIKYGAVTDCSKDVIPFITEAEVSDYHNQLLQDGDVLIADAAEDKTVGKATEIAGISDIPVVSGLHTIACRPKLKMQPNYLGYYMNSPSYHQQLLPLMQGIKVLSISRTNLAKTTICYPTSEQEQLRIGTVFADLDNLITLHQLKLEKLQSIKKAYLNEMFV